MPPRPDEKLRARGIKLLELGDFTAAAEQFRRLARGSQALEDRVLLAQSLARSGRQDAAEAELRALLAQAPDEPDLHACLGQVIARTSRRVAAIAHFERALALSPGHWAAAELTALKAQISQSVHSWHLPMLADAARSDAFDAAIRATVHPDDLVLDIGAGTGLLAMMAARAGAGQVVACEMLPDLAELARLVVAANGYGNTITVVGKHSTELQIGRDLPRRATVLVAEIFDALLIGEGALDVFNHAREHLLAPGARIIPSAGVIRGQLAVVPRLKAMHPLENLSGFDLREFARHALEKQFYPVQLEAEHWTALSEPFDVIRFDFSHAALSRQTWTLPVRATGQGAVEAMVLWIELQVDAGTVLSSAPGSPVRHWNPVAFLFDAERTVATGDIVEIAARMGSDVLFFEIAAGG